MSGMPLSVPSRGGPEQRACQTIRRALPCAPWTARHAPPAIRLDAPDVRPPAAHGRPGRDGRDGGRRLARVDARAYYPAVGKESKSRRERARGRQDRGALTRGVSAEPSTRETGPERLLSRYGAEPIPDLPSEAKKYHLRVVTDILEGYDKCGKSVGAVWATQTWHKHHDGLAESRPSELTFGDTEMRLACKSGCHHCCHTPVAVVAAEAVLVAHVVARTFSEHDRLELKRRMEEHQAALRAGAPRRNYLCPLNVGGKCLVYEFRPFNCRMFHSFDEDACKRLFGGEEMHARLPTDRVRRQYDGLIVASANVAFNALKLDMRTLEFMAALEIALAAGDDRCERLGSGEDLFAGLPTIAPASSSSVSTPE